MPADRSTAKADEHGPALSAPCPATPWRRLPEQRLADGALAVHSRMLRLCACIETPRTATPDVDPLQRELRWHDLATGEYLETHHEALASKLAVQTEAEQTARRAEGEIRARRDAERRAEYEARARQDAERRAEAIAAELAELQARLRRSPVR